ncbi:hypothetical protein O0I10_010964 [Lichtheimia ornata]|uniref:Nuclear pore complex protein Nup85 n=1 Tax=Lichtheimia ornata TaxID=688661 RepID=A0AAD7UTS4_9FUNG|nr:uncharacterized protein O0I10_010964 [Lichtheimia ornata]KAJ8653418.1 hypothetical protein O0I10_010964 [Lichtheimia ornata]
MHDLYQCFESIAHENTYPERWKLYERSAIQFRAMRSTVDNAIQPLGSSETFTAYMDEYITSLRGSQSFTDLMAHSGFSAYQEIKMFEQKYNLWKLCEILYFGQEAEEVKSIKLLALINKIDRSYLKYDIQDIYSHPTPWLHPKFWPMMCKLVLRRKLEDAYQFIQRLNTTDPALQMLAKMLHDAPIIPSHNSTDAHQQFAHDIQQWHQQLDSIHRQAQVAMSNQQQQGLLDVLSILRGDGPTIVKHADTSTEAIVAYLIYHDALASLDEIQQIAKRITISRCDAHQIDERSVNAFAWMLQGRICEALESFPHADWWLLTHILYLFDLIGMRYVGDTIVHLPSPSSKKDIALSFHDLVLLMHTRELAAQPELWQYSLDYLDTCYCKEKRHVGLLQSIKHMPRTNPADIQRLLDYCIENDDPRAVKELFKTIKDHKMEASCFTNAVKYLLVAGEYSALEYVSDAAMQHYAITGQLVEFAGLESKKLDRDWRLPKTQFYLQFQEWKRIKSPEEKMEVLYDMLTSEGSPVEYIPLLFLEGVIALEYSSVGLLNYQTIALKSTLQDFSQRKGNDERAFELVAYNLERMDAENHPKIQDALDLYRETFVDVGTDFIKRSSG